MNESVGLDGEPEPTANSLIFTGLTFRTFSAILADCIPPAAWFSQKAVANKSPLKAADPEVTVKVALTLAPGAIVSENDFEASLLPETTAFHSLGTMRLNLSPIAGVPVVFLNV